MKLKILFLLVLTVFIFACKDHREPKSNQELLAEAIAINDYSHAIEIAHKILDVEEDNDIRFNTLQKLVNAYTMIANNYAIIELLEANKENFTKPQEQIYIYENLLQAYTNLQIYSYAISYIQKLIILKEYTVSELEALELDILQYSLALHDFEQAEKYLITLENITSPENIKRLYFLTTNFYFLKNDYEKTIEWVNIYNSLPITTDEEKALAYVLLGDSYEWLDEPEKALEAFSQALLHHPNKPALEVRIANLQNSIKK